MSTDSSPSAPFFFRVVAVTDPMAQALIAALNAELLAAYPEPGATHFQLDPAEVWGDRGAFLVALDSATGHPVGCGAVRRIASGTGELKRMYVVPESRGRAVGRALVAALEGASRGIGLRRVVLETGIRQTATMALYERTGFSRIPAFGEYEDSPTSVCYGKNL